MATYGQSARSNAYNWFLHRITGTFLLFLLITHFWIQHYDHRAAVISHSVVSTEAADRGELPVYPESTRQAVQGAGRTQVQGDVTPYDVVMMRLADPVYAVLWKGFNILFLIFALHHGFYGLNNIISDYVRNDMLRATAVTLSWTVALVLLVIGLYSVITAGW